MNRPRNANEHEVIRYMETPKPWYNTKTGEICHMTPMTVFNGSYRDTDYGAEWKPLPNTELAEILYHDPT